MKRVICLILTMLVLSTNALAATYYEVNVEKLTAKEKKEVTEWLEDEGYDYNVDLYSDSHSSSRSKSAITGSAYLVANGYLWYIDGDDVEKVDTIYSSEYVLFTSNGAISYINKSNNGMLIEDVEYPTDKEKISSSARSINKNSSGYAISFKISWDNSKKIVSDNNFDNDNIAVYVVKGNTLYSLSPKNVLTKLKLLKSMSINNTYTYSKNYLNIGISEWGDLVLVDSSGIVWFNERVGTINRIETLKDQNGYTVKAKFLAGENGIVESVILTDGSSVELEDD